MAEYKKDLSPYTSAELRSYSSQAMLRLQAGSIHIILDASETRALLAMLVEHDHLIARAEQALTSFNNQAEENPNA